MLNIREIPVVLQITLHSCIMSCYNIYIIYTHTHCIYYTYTHTPFYFSTGLTWHFREVSLLVLQSGQQVLKSQFSCFQTSNLLCRPHAGLVLDTINQHAKGKKKSIYVGWGGRMDNKAWVTSNTFFHTFKWHGWAVWQKKSYSLIYRSSLSPWFPGGTAKSGPVDAAKTQRGSDRFGICQ